MATNRKYGWVPDVPSLQDIPYLMYTREKITRFPDSVDLREKMPPVYDQKNLGSCTSMATAAALEYDRIIQGLEVWLPSRLFIYYNTRKLEDSVESDSGGTLRDSIKTVAKQGAPIETLWPYVEEKFADEPTPEAYTEAQHHTAIQYMRINNSDINELKRCLVAGFPFVFGMSVYESFESDEVAKTGVIPMPKETEKMQGGHAVLGVGYKNETSCFICRNSWSSSWGDLGYFYIPYDYLTTTDLADDFWTIRKVQ